MWPDIKPSQPLSFGSNYGAMPTFSALAGLGVTPTAVDGATDAVTGGYSASSVPGATALGAAPTVPGMAPGGVPGIAPGAAGAGGWLKGIGGLDGLAEIAKGIGSIGGLVAAFKGLGLAKDQFAFQKDAYNTNLTNQTQSYNTALAERAMDRFQGTGSATAVADAEAYIAKNRL